MDEEMDKEMMEWLDRWIDKEMVERKDTWIDKQMQGLMHTLDKCKGKYVCRPDMWRTNINVH
jgi:hypothetical protein